VHGKASPHLGRTWCGGRRTPTARGRQRWMNTRIGAWIGGACMTFNRQHRVAFPWGRVAASIGGAHRPPAHLPAAGMREARGDRNLMEPSTRSKATSAVCSTVCAEVAAASAAGSLRRHLPEPQGSPKIIQVPSARCLAKFDSAATTPAKLEGGRGPLALGFSRWPRPRLVFMRAGTLNIE